MTSTLRVSYPQTLLPLSAVSHKVSDNRVSLAYVARLRWLEARAKAIHDHIGELGLAARIARELERGR